jgi:hypothetical protein
MPTERVVFLLDPPPGGSPRHDVADVECASEHRYHEAAEQDDVTGHKALPTSTTLKTAQLKTSSSWRVSDALLRAREQPAGGAPFP